VKGKILSSPDNPQLDLPLVNSDLQPPVQLVLDPLSPPVLAPPPPAPKAGENPVWSGWDVLLMGVLTALLVLVVVPVVVVCAARLFVYPHQSMFDIARRPALALLSEFFAYILVALYMIFLVEGKYHARFWQAIRWNWPGIAGVSMVGIGVLMVAFDYLGARFLPMPKNTPFDQFFTRPLDAYLLAAFAVTFGPLMEELFFRGFLYPVLARRAGAGLAILGTGLLFGLIHSPQYGFSWAAVLIVSLVGVVLASIRAATKSVAASFLAHVGYNGTLMALAALATDGFRHMDKAAALLACLKLGTRY
jgi:membrane protease YdiL (CAAX protease family)